MENSLEYGLNAKGAILKKNNIPFIVYFCLGKYSFRLNTFKHVFYEFLTTVVEDD